MSHQRRRDPAQDLEHEQVHLRLRRVQLPGRGVGLCGEKESSTMQAAPAPGP
jgi:hypothetical protein